MNEPAQVGDVVNVWGGTYKIVRRREASEFEGLSGPSAAHLLMRSESDDKLYWTYQYTDNGVIGLPSPAPFSDRG